jgi:hypothetical protein
MSIKIGSVTLPSPATVLTVNPADFNIVNIMPQELGGVITAAPEKVVPVNYPSSGIGSDILAGTAALDAAIKATSGPKVVFAYSEGASASTVWLIQHAAASTVPAEDLIFVFIGNPNRYTGLYGKTNPNASEVYQQLTPTDSKYTVIDIARKGDFFADFANLSVLQYLSGFFTHCNYTGVNPNAAGNTVTTTGTTTYVTTA